MAVRQATLLDISPTSHVRLVTWSDLLNTDTGSPVDWTEYADRCFQVTGTFGAAGACTIQGSNDGTNWAPLTDPQGNNLVFSAQKIEQAMELPRYVRPNITAGDGTTSLVVTLCMRKGR